MPTHTPKERAKNRKKLRDVTQSIMGNKNTRALLKKVDPPKKRKKKAVRKKR